MPIVVSRMSSKEEAWSVCFLKLSFCQQRKDQDEQGVQRMKQKKDKNNNQTTDVHFTVN